MSLLLIVEGLTATFKMKNSNKSAVLLLLFSDFYYFLMHTNPHHTLFYKHTFPHCRVEFVKRLPVVGFRSVIMPTVIVHEKLYFVKLIPSIIFGWKYSPKNAWCRPSVLFIDAPAHGISTNNSLCGSYRWIARNSAHVHARGRLDLAIGYEFDAHCWRPYSNFQDEEQQ